MQDRSTRVGVRDVVVQRDVALEHEGKVVTRHVSVVRDVARQALPGHRQREQPLRDNVVDVRILVVVVALASLPRQLGRGLWRSDVLGSQVQYRRQHLRAQGDTAASACVPAAG